MEASLLSGQKCNRNVITSQVVSLQLAAMHGQEPCQFRIRAMVKVLMNFDKHFRLCSLKLSSLNQRRQVKLVRIVLKCKAFVTLLI